MPLPDHKSRTKFNEPFGRLSNLLRCQYGGRIASNHFYEPHTKCMNSKLWTNQWKLTTGQKVKYKKMDFATHVQNKDNALAIENSKIIRNLMAFNIEKKNALVTESKPYNFDEMESITKKIHLPTRIDVVNDADADADDVAVAERKESDSEVTDVARVTEMQQTSKILALRRCSQELERLDMKLEMLKSKANGLNDE